MIRVRLALGKGSSRAGGPRAAAAAETLDIAVSLCGNRSTVAALLSHKCSRKKRSSERLRRLTGHGPMQAEPSNQCPPRVVRCERVLRKRTKSVLLVLDRITDPHNEAAAHRCAEALGVQHVWTVAPPLQPVKKRPKRDTKSVAKGADVSFITAALRQRRVVRVGAARRGLGHLVRGGRRGCRRARK